MGSYKKKLFIVLSLFLLISCFVCSSVNATSPDYVVDSVSLVRSQQELLAAAGLSFLNKYGSTSLQQDFKNLANNDAFYTLWTYQQNTNPQNYITIFCYFIPKRLNWDYYDSYLMDYEDSYFEDSFLVIPKSGYQFTPSNVGYQNFQRFVFYGNGVTPSMSTYTNLIFLPSSLVLYNNETVLNYCNGINPSTSPWAMLQNAINNNTDAVEDTTQAVNNLRNDFNAEESDEDYDFPTDNPTTDPTSSGIDNIFNMFYMRINSWNALGINVPIPFTGKSFTINPDITENIINGWTPSTQIATVFKTLLSGVWYYLLGRYIVKDVQHYVDGLQTGDILTKSDTNIKTEML